jgi:hypothetical protein
VSVDWRVVGSKALTPEQVARALGDELAGLLDGPQELQAEDVPAEVAGEAGDGVWVGYTLSVPARDGEQALAAAARLAKAVRGVVCGDDQVVWGEGPVPPKAPAGPGPFAFKPPTLKARGLAKPLTPPPFQPGADWPVAKPTAEQRIMALFLDWHGVHAAAQRPVTEVLAEQAMALFPEALPRRFGHYEPPQDRFDRVGAAGLTAAWQAGADWDLILTGSGLPCLGGGVYSWAPGDGLPRMWHLSLAFIGDTFRDAAWCDGLRAFFTAVADRAPALYAKAEVVPGLTYSGQQLFYRYKDKSAQNPYDRGRGLLGVTRRPTWWAWFGGGYLPLVADRLDRPPTTWRVTASAAGRLAELAARPTTAVGLGHAWFPRHLRVRPGILGPRPARLRPPDLLA